MDHPLTSWCLENKLDTTKFKECGIKAVEEMTVLYPSETEEIIVKCSMNIGDRLRFRLAVQKLQAGRFISTKSLVASSTLVDSHDTPVSLPFDCFEDDFDEIDLPDIHEAVKLGLGMKWKEGVHALMTLKVKEHLEKSENVKAFMAETQSTLNEVAAAVYYSCDGRMFGGKDKHSIYKIINPLLANRNKKDLGPWQVFLFYFCSAEEKFPKLPATQTFRGITTAITAISPQYKPGNEVVWPAFTSVSRTEAHLDKFSQGGRGTWMIIDTVDARDISKISMIPKEAEALLFPNTVVLVCDLTTSQQRTPQDVIHLRQQPTPQDHKPLHILAKRRTPEEITLRELYPTAFKGDPDALYEIGRLYFFDHKPSYQKSLKYLLPAGKQGHAGAQFLIGKMYFNGFGVKPDTQRALEYFLLSANQGDPEAVQICEAFYAKNSEVQICLGKVYFGFSRNTTKSLEYCFCSAQQGNQEAHSFLDELYSSTLLHTKKLYPKDLFGDLSKSFLTKSYHHWPYVKSHHLQEQFFLERSKTHPIAHFILGQMYFDGWGCPRDLDQAAHHLRLAADEGHSESLNTLGAVFLKKHDATKASQCFEASATQGNPLAQHNLGILFWKGRGVPQNHPKAVENLTLAANQGIIKASEALDQFWISIEPSVRLFKMSGLFFIIYIISFFDLSLVQTFLLAPFVLLLVGLLRVEQKVMVIMMYESLTDPLSRYLEAKFSQFLEHRAEKKRSKENSDYSNLFGSCSNFSPK